MLTSKGCRQWPCPGNKDHNNVTGSATAESYNQLRIKSETGVNVVAVEQITGSTAVNVTNNVQSTVTFVEYAE